MILAFIKMNVRPEKRKELRQTIQSVVADIKQERGCLESSFYQNAENENEFFLVQKWETQQELDEHRESVRYTVLMGTKILLHSPLEINTHLISE
jgi:quinol monooxygenase YgiN